ncbi:hypothetical protein K2173_021413 [Erythroxylum novogranatense]|uniref:Uncharacterized protein n=1 Tax=Erythroxylum novogranatense TaxID=1862640 RepID=A0AAV8TUY5_9ROSI|nr:hypothetical protein K2173_021413 [Erythroxylum novogranatense]
MDNLIVEVVASLVYNATEATIGFPESKSVRSLASFEWGGTISSLFLLILNQTGRKSSMQTTLLALYLFISFPSVFFMILRGELGYWVAFLLTAANLFFPENFPVSRFTLFVVTPNWLADGLRTSIVGGVMCLIIGILTVITEMVGEGFRTRSCVCNLRCFGYCIGTAFLLFFTMLYLCLGLW